MEAIRQSILALDNSLKVLGTHYDSQTSLQLKSLNEQINLFEKRWSQLIDNLERCSARVTKAGTRMSFIPVGSSWNNLIWSLFPMWRQRNHPNVASFDIRSRPKWTRQRSPIDNSPMITLPNMISICRQGSSSTGSIVSNAFSRRNNPLNSTSTNDKRSFK